MGKQGRRTPEPIREFIIDQKRTSPGLTQAAIATMVQSKYGVDAKIDQSTVGLKIREAIESGELVVNQAGEGAITTGMERFAIPEEWPVGYLNNGEPLRGDAAKRWSTGRPQRVGDEFLLDFGRELPFKGIIFRQGTQHQWDRPKRWHMTLSNVYLIIEEIEGAGIIELMLEEAVRLRYIGVDILEPRLPTDLPPARCWAIDNIELYLAD